MINRFLHRPIGVWTARIVFAAGFGVLGLLLNGMNPWGAVYFVVAGFAVVFVLDILGRRRGSN